VSADPNVGVRPTTTPETVVIDYSAPNVAKEMHVGHLRSTVIGDSLVRLREFVGDKVMRENHIGDWGTPFGMLIEHLLDEGEARHDNALQVGELGEFYRAARAKFDSDDEFKERARRRVVSLQAFDPETMQLWQRLVDESTRYFNVVYGKLGVLLTDDDVAGESMYHRLLPEVIRRLDEKGLLQESDGAKVVFPAGFTNREGEPLPLIVQKRDGGFNYGTSDLACVIDRVERLGATLLVYVVGAPQAQHLQMVFAVSEQAGWLRPPARAVHVGFGNVLGPDRKMFKTRSGDTVRLEDLLDEAVERATAQVEEKSHDLSADTKAAVAKAVGIGALKYADLSSDRIKDYVFDWDRMLASTGDTGPYLQYAVARIRSIFEKAGKAGQPPGPITLTAPAERRLALEILGFEPALTAAMDQREPHRLAGYLHGLAVAFSVFYERCPILRADEPVRASRLALADRTGRTLALGLHLLGIEVPDAM
jgi:arginyl-tRNA synthetase